MKYSIINLDIKGDDRGSLISLEANQTIPFDIRRVYYIFDTKLGIRRGLHAHRNLQQVLIAVNGSCKVLLDDGLKKAEILLNSANQGLLVKKMIWREMFDFSEDCVLLVLASDFYDEKDYIRSYDEFLKLI